MGKFILGRARLMTLLIAFAALVVIGHGMADAADAAMSVRAYLHANGSPCIGCTSGGYIQQTPDSRSVTFPSIPVTSISPFILARNSYTSTHAVFALLLSFLLTSPINPPVIV